MSARTCASATKPAPRRAAPLTARRRAARCAAAPRNGLLSAGLTAAVPRERHVVHPVQALV